MDGIADAGRQTVTSSLDAFWRDLERRKLLPPLSGGEKSGARAVGVTYFESGGFTGAERAQVLSNGPTVNDNEH